MGSLNDTYLPVAGAQFRHVPKRDPPDPIPSLALLTPNQEGRFIQSGFGDVLKRIPTWYAISEILLTALASLLIAFSGSGVGVDWSLPPQPANIELSHG